VNPLPPELERLLARFSGESWRARKQAVKDLQTAIERNPPPAGAFEALIERLLDGLTAESVPARSTCHEMLVYLGSRGLEGTLRRLALGGRGARMYVDLLADIGGPEQVPLLTAVLLRSSEDDNVRASAAAALGAIGGPAAEHALKGALASSSDMLQLFALDALRSIGASLAVDTLMPLVENAVTRRAATSLLAHSATPEALELLLALLRDSMAGVRAAAALALVTLDAALADQGRPDAVAGALIGSVDETVRQRLRELVDHRQIEVKIAALELCRMTRDTGALRHVLPDMSEPVVRERAVGFVTSLGAAAGGALAELLPAVPAAALADYFLLIGALGDASSATSSTPDPRLVAALIHGLTHPEPGIASVAAGSLGRLGAAAAFAPLAEALAAADPLGEAAATALASLAQRHGPGAPPVQALLRGAAAATGARARNLCRVLGALGHGEASPFVPPLVALLGSDEPGVRFAAATALGHIGGEHEGVTALCLALADGHQSVRAAACRSLGQLGAASACQALLQASTDDSAQVRAAAVQALVSLDNPVALGRLREIVLSDSAPGVVIPALAGLGHSGSDLDLTMLMSLCRSSDHEVAKAAARGLVRFSAHRATAAVLGLLDHDRWDVRWAAAEVLAERGDLTALAPLRRVQAVEHDPLVRQVLGGAVGRLEGLAAADSGEPAR
jgi:HEAT repeat protein